MARRSSSRGSCSIQSTTTTTTTTTASALIQWKQVMRRRQMMTMVPLLLMTMMMIVQQQQQQQRTRTNEYDTVPVLCHAFTATTTYNIVKVRQQQQQHQQANVRSIHSNLLSSTTKLYSGRVINNDARKDENDILNRNSNMPLLSSSTSSVTSTGSHSNDLHTVVPTTLNEALRIFFMSSQYHGPRLIVVFLSILFYQRIELLGSPVAVTSSMMDQSQLLNVLKEISVAGIAILFWWIQEHVLHQRLLHSQHFHWIGKDIHVQHHNQPYYHISIDSASIMISWLMIVHLVLRFGLGTILPLPFIYTATIAYGIAGLFYEWTHFIVHTKVRFATNSFWTKVRDHHARHHLINHDNYFAFTITQIDDLFGTNPDVTKVPRLKKNGMII